MAVGKPTKMVHSRHLLDRSVERIMFRKLDNNNTINSGGGDIEKNTKKNIIIPLSTTHLGKYKSLEHPSTPGGV